MLFRMKGGNKKGRIPFLLPCIFRVKKYSNGTVTCQISGKLHSRLADIILHVAGLVMYTCA